MLFKAFQNQLVNVQSTCTAVYVVCLQCRIKKMVMASIIFKQVTCLVKGKTKKIKDTHTSIMHTHKINRRKD